MAIPSLSDVVRSGTSAFEAGSGGAALGPLDVWAYTIFGNGTATANDLFTGAAISSGTNATAIPASSLVGGALAGLFLRSGTTANGGYRYTTTSATAFRFGTGVPLKFVGRWMSLTDHTGRLVRIGFHDANSATDAVDGAYFEINAGVCTAKTANNSVRTSNPTTVTLVLSSLYTFHIDENADGTSIRFRVFRDGNTTPVLDVTNTTNIPTATTRAFGAGVVATETTTTASDIGIVFGMGYGTVAAYDKHAA